MPAQRQTEARIIGDDVFAFARWCEHDRRLRDRRALQDFGQALDAGDIPQRAATMTREARARACRGKRLAVALIESSAANEILYVGKSCLLARRGDTPAAGFGQAFDETEAETECG